MKLEKAFNLQNVIVIHYIRAFQPVVRLPPVVLCHVAGGIAGEENEPKQPNSEGQQLQDCLGSAEAPVAGRAPAD